MQPHRGFSLIEMLVVIAIIGVIAALAAPAMLPMLRSSRGREASSIVASAVEDGRRRAVTEGRCYRVTMVQPNRIALERHNSSDCVNSGTLDSDGWTATRTVDISPATATISDTAGAAGDEIVFRPNSRLRGDGTLTNTEYGARVLVQSVGPSFGVVDIDRRGRICERVAIRAPAALTAPVTITSTSCP